MCINGCLCVGLQIRILISQSKAQGVYCGFPHSVSHYKDILSASTSLHLKLVPLICWELVSYSIISLTSFLSPTNWCTGPNILYDVYRVIPCRLNKSLLTHITKYSENITGCCCLCNRCCIVLFTSVFVLRK